MKGGDHFVDTRTAGRKIKGSFKMWLALAEIQTHGTSERLMLQQEVGWPTTNSYCGRRKLIKS